jgi:HAD superfamily phosphoserine phosphatase-like hydrolase
MARHARTKPVQLGIFDIDGTVFRSSLLIETFNALVDDGIFPKRASAQVERNFLAWLDRKGHYDDYLMTLVRVYYRELKGKRPDRVEPVIDRVVQRQRHRVYRYTRDLIAELRRKRHFLIAISNSQAAMVERFAAAVGFDAAIGRVLEVKRGVYTGKNLIDGKPFPVDVKLDKPDLLRTFLRERGMAADLERSVSVGDSEGDTDILSIVGRPIAFNPSYEFARTAKRRGWPIVVERKDVMYRIRDADMLVARERPKRSSVAKFYAKR